MSNKSHFFRQSIIKSLVFYDRFNNDNFNEIDNLQPIAENITFQTRLGGFTGVFNGVNTNVIYGNQDYFSFTNDSKDLPFTIGGYINADTVIGNKFLISKRLPNAVNEYQFFILGNKLRFDFYDNNTGGVLTSLSTTIQANTDYCFILTYDGSGDTNGINIYLNGVSSVESVTNNNNYKNMTKTMSDFFIGRRSINIPLWFDGKIDNLFIFNYVIDSLQIADINTKVLNNNDIR
jgi:hypothetical protein